jgi:DNA-binding NtrC family response regulator
MAFTEEAKKKLMSYSYPGNVRELKAAIELAIILSNDRKIDAQNINFITVESGDDLIKEEMTLDEHILKIRHPRLPQTKPRLFHKSILNL